MTVRDLLQIEESEQLAEEINNNNNNNNNNSAGTDTGLQINNNTKNIEFSVDSIYPLSELDNELNTTNTGSIDQGDGEIRLQTGSNINGSATLDTVRVGTHIPGQVSEVGISLRISNVAPSVNHKLVVGKTDGDNGIYFGLDSTGFFIEFVKRNTTTDPTPTPLRIDQTNWSEDPLNGTGESGIDLNDNITNNEGIKFILNYESIYGLFEFFIEIVRNNEIKKLLVHKQFNSIPQILDLNVPLRVQIDNNGTGTNWEVRVNNRYYANFGDKKQPGVKVTAQRLDQNTLSNNRKPLVAFRRKTLYNGRQNHIEIFLGNICIGSDNREHAIEIFIDDIGEVSGGTWSDPEFLPSNESALEINNNPANYTPSTNALRLYTSGLLKDVAFTLEDLNTIVTQFKSLPKNKELILVVTPIDGNGLVEITSLSLIENR
jgi:hypothetical protein